MGYLVNACEEMNEEFSLACSFVRIEDIIRHPAKTFQLPQLHSPTATTTVDYDDIPVFEKDIEGVLYRDKKVKSFIQKFQYHTLQPEFGDAVIPGTMGFLGFFENCLF